MHTPAPESGTATPNGGLGAAAKQVAEHASALARLELELAGLELKRKLAALGIGVGLALGAVVILLFALGFGLAAAAAGLSSVLDTWVALLIVTGGLVVLALVLLMAAFGKLKKGTPPVPEQAIAEAKRTTEALKSNGS